MEEKRKLILLYSGGLDSTVLFKMALKAKYQFYCVLFDYGQKHIKELEKAKNQCLAYDIPFQIIKLPDLGINSGLTGSNETGTFEGVSEWHVPARNLMFISQVASLAEYMKYPLIWYGANYSDRENLFPDCYQEWVYELNKLLAINGSFPIRVEAPLLGMQKETIQALAKTYNIKLQEVHSGYGTE